MNDPPKIYGDDNWHDDSTTLPGARRWLAADCTGEAEDVGSKMAMSELISLVIFGPQRRLAETAALKRLSGVEW